MSVLVRDLQINRTNRICAEREKEIYFKEFVYKIVGLASPNFARQADRLETQGRIDVAGQVQKQSFSGKLSLSQQNSFSGKLSLCS